MEGGGVCGGKEREERDAGERTKTAERGTRTMNEGL